MALRIGGGVPLWRSASTGATAGISSSIKGTELLPEGYGINITDDKKMILSGGNYSIRPSSYFDPNKKIRYIKFPDGKRLVIDLDRSEIREPTEEELKRYYSVHSRGFDNY